MSNIITENFFQSKPAIDSIESFCDKYVTSGVLMSCGIKKQADIEEAKAVEYIVPDELTTALSELSVAVPQDTPSTKKVCKCVAAKKLFRDYMLCFLLSFSIFRLFKSHMFFEGYKKDTLYRFLEIEGARWEHLQLVVASHVIADIESDTTDAHTNVLIFDDTLYKRAGSGRGTQFCGKVYDHNDHKMRTGYRMMTGAWSNGEVTIPFSQTLLTSCDPKYQMGDFTMRDGRTVGGKRDRRAIAKGTTTVVRMVKEAQRVNIPFDYVLFDTWFSKPAQLVELKQEGADVIAMVAKTSTKYTVKDPITGEEQAWNLKEIFSRNKKRRGKSRYLLSVTGTVTKGDETIAIKLVFVRNRNNRKDWICFVCTDTTLDEHTILTTYTLRWAVEVYFKTVKSHLRLTSECHSTKYDALTAHMVIVAIRYMALAVDTYRRSDNRTITDLFDQAKREVINTMVNSAIITVIDCLIDAIFELIQVTPEMQTKIYACFYDKLPNYWKERFKAPTSAA